MKFTPNQDFLHGYDRYEKGVEYELDDQDLVRYFINNGWADADGSDTLDVHDSSLGQGN